MSDIEGRREYRSWFAKPGPRKLSERLREVECFDDLLATMGIEPYNSRAPNDPTPELIGRLACEIEVLEGALRIAEQTNKIAADCALLALNPPISEAAVERAKTIAQLRETMDQCRAAAKAATNRTARKRNQVRAAILDRAITAISQRSIG